MTTEELNTLQVGTKVNSPSGISYEISTDRFGRKYLTQTRKNKAGQNFGQCMPLYGTTRTFNGWTLA